MTDQTDADSRRRRPRDPRFLRPLRRASEWLLAILIVGAPVTVGGVHPETFIAVGVLGGAAAFLAVVGRRDPLPVPWATWALLGGATLAVATVVPLPLGLVAWLSPRAAALSHLKGDPAPAFVRLSLDAPATLVDLSRLFGLVGVALASGALATREGGARRLARWVAVAALTVIAVSLVHIWLGVTELFGLVPQSFAGRSYTTFVDPNHAASFALLATMACLGLAATSAAGDLVARLWWYGGALACTAMAFSTQSVGGLTALAFALGLYTLLTIRRRNASTARALLPGAVVVVVVMGGIWVSVFVTDSWDLVRQAAASKVDAWPETLRLVRDFPWTGVGRGAFSSAFQAYEPPRLQVTYTHPENFVLEWAATWGVPAAVLGIVALLATFATVLRGSARLDTRRGLLQDALLAGVVGVLLHDLADFGLEYAGVGVAFAATLGIIGAAAPVAVRRTATPVAVGLCAVGAAACAAFVAMPRLADAQLTEASFHTEFTEGATAASIGSLYRSVLRWHPADFLVPMRAVEALFRHSTDPVGPSESRAALAAAEPFLDRAAELTQSDWPAMSRAWLLAREGHRVQALAALSVAYQHGVHWKEVAQFALRIGATPAELSQLPMEEGATLRDLSGPMCGLLDTLPRGRTSRLVADLFNERLQTAGSEVDGLRDCVCTAFINAANCSRDESIGCDDPTRAAGIFSETVAFGRRWTDVSPGDARAWLCVAQGYGGAGALEERSRTLAMAVEHIPGDPLLRAALAGAQLDAGHPQLALDALGTGSIRANGRAQEIAATVRVRAFWALGQRMRALREVDDLIRLNPNAGWVYPLGISLKEQAGDLGGAESLLLAARRTASEAQRAELDAWKSRLEQEQHEAQIAKPHGAGAIAP